MFAALFLYEPLLVSRRGATIGHARNHLSVIDTHTGRPPGFLRAALRFAIKIFLGLASFVTMALTRRHQAVHDVFTRTTVQVDASYDAAPGEYHVERPEENSALPTRRRRIAVVMVCLSVALIAAGWRGLLFGARRRGAK